MRRVIWLLVLALVLLILYMMLTVRSDPGKGLGVVISGVSLQAYDDLYSLRLGRVAGAACHRSACENAKGDPSSRSWSRPRQPVSLSIIGTE
jgi:hypothetical protein